MQCPLSGRTLALRLTFLLAVVPAFSQRYASAADIHVPANHATIQSAIDAAADGDTVIVSPGRYVENIDFLGKAITVRSIDPLDEQIVESTIIDGGASGPCVKFVNKETSDSVISGFTITNGYASGVFFGDNLGGGIFCSYSSPTISYNIIKLNFAEVRGGGISCSDGAATIISNQIMGNTVGGYGYGGGLFVSPALMRDAPQPMVMNNRILQNFADMGGGLYCRYNATIQGNEVILNSANGHAGGVLLQDMLQGGSLGRNTICFNSAGSAGGIEVHMGWLVVLTGNTVSNNTAVREGGGILSRDNSEIYNCIIEGNVSGLGGAIDGTFDAHFNTVVGNRPVGLNCEGGWLLEGNLIHDNGIGIDVEWKNLMIVGNTISGNSTGIYNHEGDGSTMACNTIVGNTLGLNDATNVMLTDTIVTSSITTNIKLNRDAGLAIQSCLVEGGAGEIAIEDTSHLTWGPGNIDADPLFVDPGQWDDAGTPDDPSDDTFIPGDYHLLPGSPCIDAGTNDVDNPDTPEIETLPATDIAGLPRIIDGNLDGTVTIDIGAYEHLPGDVNYDGRVNVLDLILVRNSLGRDPASSIQARKADVNADGAVNVQDLLIVRGRLGR